MFLALACLFQAGEEFVTQLGMALGSRGNRQVPRELQGPKSWLESEAMVMRMTGWWFQIFFYVHPYLGKIPILTNIFQMGWNHQLDEDDDDEDDDDWWIIIKQDHPSDKT